MRTERFLAFPVTGALLLWTGCDTGTFTLGSLNQPPRAHAGADTYMTTGERATLDGSASTDADGDLLSYHWYFVSGPEIVSLQVPGTSTIEFRPSSSGIYEFALIVIDDRGGSDEDTVRVIVTNGHDSTSTPPPSPPDTETPPANPDSDEFSTLLGNWSGSQRNPYSGETFELALELDSAGATFSGTITIRGDTIWRIAGRTIDPESIPTSELALWELVIGSRPEPGMRLIRFSPTSKIAGNFLRGEFWALIDGDRMSGLHIDPGTELKEIVLSKLPTEERAIAGN